MTLLGLLAAALVATNTTPRLPDTVVVAAEPPVSGPVARPAGAQTVQPPDTTRRRRRAVEVSEGYARRLTVHRIGAYAMLPLFAAQYALGEKMLGQKEDAFRGVGAGVSDGVRNAHRVVAGGVGAVFAVNTVTGVWNLYETREQAEGRARRTTHALLMLAADAGFVATGILGVRAADRAPSDARTHRSVGLVSMGVSTLSAAVMLLTRD